LLAGASLREIARRYAVSPMAVQTAVQRLGRQAMAAQLQLLGALRPRPRVVFDGLRSSTGGQDYPCDITTVVESGGETILTMEHTIFRRGGRMRAAQRRRALRRYARWCPKRGTMHADISRLTGEIWDYLRPHRPQQDVFAPAPPATVDTDEHPLYRAVLARSAVCEHYRRGGLLRHITTPGCAPRTRENRLFAVNYVDRLLRHRLREHTRESIALGRHAALQMHRAWIFAADHNVHRPWRVRRPQAGVHAARDAADAHMLRRLSAGFFRRRILPPHAAGVPETIRRVWFCELPTPPVRWRRRQRGTSVTVPAFARRDLAGAYQQGS
jgi:hypothetical protein